MLLVFLFFIFFNENINEYNNANSIIINHRRVVSLGALKTIHAAIDEC